jgi:hypothetical protein
MNDFNYNTQGITGDTQSTNGRGTDWTNVRTVAKRDLLVVMIGVLASFRIEVCCTGPGRSPSALF